MPLARAALESLLRSRQLDRTLTCQLVCRPPPRLLMNTRLPRPALRHSMRGSAAGCRAGSFRNSSAPRSSGRRACSLRCSRPPPARRARRARRRARHVRCRISRRAGVVFDRFSGFAGMCACPRAFAATLNQRATRAGHPCPRARAPGRQLRHGGVRCRRCAGRGGARLPFTTWLRLQRMIEGRRRSVCSSGTNRWRVDAAGLTSV